jgi:hypothetical protein
VAVEPTTRNFAIDSKSLLLPIKPYNIRYVRISDMLISQRHVAMQPVSFGVGKQE